MYEEVESDIWLVQDEVDYHDGYYFSDETNRFDGNGPFGTIEECRDNLRIYAVELNQERKIEKQAMFGHRYGASKKTLDEFIDMTPQRGIWTNFIWSLLWLVILLVGMGMITDQVGAFWDVMFGLLFIAIIAQLWHLMTRFDDASTRQRMWNKMRKPVKKPCPHGHKDWDDCPDCCH